jgi:hypothetical protein
MPTEKWISRLYGCIDGWSLESELDLIGELFIDDRSHDLTLIVCSLTVQSRGSRCLFAFKRYTSFHAE